MYCEIILSNRGVPEREAHPFHLVNPSPWPVAVGLASLGLAQGLVLVFHAHCPAICL
jgi:hypothetical protein